MQLEQKKKKRKGVLSWLEGDTSGHPFPSHPQLNVTINCRNQRDAMAKLDRNLRRSKHSCLLKLLTHFTVLQNVRVHHAVTLLLRIICVLQNFQVKPQICN